MNIVVWNGRSNYNLLLKGSHRKTNRHPLVKFKIIHDCNERKKEGENEIDTKLSGEMQGKRTDERVNRSKKFNLEIWTKVKKSISEEKDCCIGRKQLQVSYLKHSEAKISEIFVLEFDHPFKREAKNNNSQSTSKENNQLTNEQ